MTQYAAGLKTIVDNGREHRTDGLLKHIGRVEAGSFRAMSSMDPINGEGVEVGYYPVGGYGYIQAYDRTNSAWKDLQINAKNLNLQTLGGALTLPANCIGASQIIDGTVGTAELQDGSITTAKIAANSINVLMSQWIAASAFTCNVGPWVESDMRVQATFTGVPTLIAWSVMVANNTLGMNNYIGIGVDGAAGWHVAQWTTPSANFWTTISGSFVYPSLSAGVHRISVFGGVQGGLMSFHASAHNLLGATEFRR